MPCHDVTEILALRLDAEDRLTDYRLRKKTCMRGVGAESLLVEQLTGRDAATLASLDVEQIVEELDIEDDIEFFLHLKHGIAVQAGLKALLGLEPAGAGEPVRLAGVVYTEDGLEMEAEISVEMLTERIKSCGRCKGCASLSRVAAALQE